MHDSTSALPLREGVVWAYRLLLGREPEAEAVLDTYEAMNDWRAVRHAFLASAEFQAQLKHLEQSRWVAAPIAEGRLLAWIDLADRFVSAGMLFDRFEPHVTRVLEEALQPGAVFYDIGANLGWHTLRAARIVGPEGQVHAFEPRPDLAARLRASVALNNLDDIVTVHEVAVGAAAGRGSLLAVLPEHNPGHSFLGIPRVGETVVSEVEIVALDDLNLPPPNVVKLDIEGAEGSAMAGARRTLTVHRPMLVCEIFPEFLQRVSGITASQLVADLLLMGYQGGEITGQGTVSGLTTERAREVDELRKPIDATFSARPDAELQRPANADHVSAGLFSRKDALMYSELPPPIELEIFRGYTQEDQQALVSLEGSREPYSEGYVDWFGVKIGASYAPWIAERKSEVASAPPLPTDTFLSEGIEYAGLALALASASDGRFCSLELGAGWGPWSALSAMCARTRGLSHVTIGAVEADAGRFAQMRDHLALNGIVPFEAENEGTSGDVTFLLEQAAIWHEDTTLYWPVASEADSGRAVSQTMDADVDYRGFALTTVPVRAIGLPSILAKLPRVDFMHVDIQGAEALVIPACIEAIEARVALMFIGTHSRKIEGDLFDLLYSRGWRLLREQPCVFNPDLKAPTLTGLTTRDGGQVWQAPARDAAEVA